MADQLDRVLERLAAELEPVRGEPRELEGGITNRNFRVTLGERECVARLPGRDTDLLGIDRAAERLANDAAARLGLAPGVVAALEECLVTEYVACSSLEPADVAGEVETIAAALRAFHDSDVLLPARFDVAELLRDYARIVRLRGGELPEQYGEAQRAAERIVHAAPPGEPRPCHNDLLPGNLIRAHDGRVLIVDWEYAGMGDPRFDLGNLSVNNEFDEAADERLLRAYYGEEPDDARRAALKLMRVLSDAREAAWAVVQAHISELDFDFDGYAGKHFLRLHEAVAQPQFEQWLASAAPGGGA
ncbi:MAG TPA: phosphotransferase [Solirubrobacteraceae bacterium]|nr:phosphotransferase [Solirubrobacteraceae bacterium]